ncbi:MAG: ShlB/FhaC/HecB family hemolysin secretion/activation protein [Erythrobacter sp.]|nr:ShlB/FhaC/HecB family hemolysin secretion/activation protein [Erythrobacter sp.]
MALCTSVLLPLPGASASAQIAPPNRTELVPPSIRQQTERPVTLTIDGGFERAPCALDRAEYADITLTLQGADFVGLDRVEGLSLDDAYQSYVGQELPLSVLCDIRARANSALRSQGYLATVEIPQQSLADGVPDFRVVFGRLTSVRVRGDAGPSEATAARYLQKLTQLDVFNTKDAERYLLLADDLPGINVRLSLRPAANGEPGDLTGEIAVVRQKGLAFFNVQNFGSSEIGPVGATAQGEIYDLTGLGDRTSFTAFTTIDFTEQHTFRLGHDFAVGGEGARLGTSLTYSTTNPDVNLPGLDVDSESFIASAFASFPIQRTRSQSVFAEGGFDLVNQQVDVNNIGITRDRVRTAYARITGEYIDEESLRRLDGYTQFEPRVRVRYGAELRQGFGVLSASDDCRPNPLACAIGGAIPPSRIEADPTPFLVRGNISAEARPTPEWTLAGDVQVQVSNSPLPAFEEFAAGSFSIGRGYDPGAVLGDSGIAGAFELRYGSLAPKGPEAFTYQPYVFTDVALAWNEDPSRRPLNPDRLWSAGAGVRAALGSKLQGDLMVAVPLERPDLAPSRGDVRVMFSVTALLFPWRY